MGEIVAAAVVAHVPTVMLDADVRRRLGGSAEDTTLVEGYRRLRARFEARGVDTRVIFDTHWFTTTEHVVAGAAHHRGAYTSEELPRVIHELPFDYPGAPELAQAIRGVARHRGIRVTNAITPTLPRHHPTINLVHHMHRDEKVLSVSVCQTADLDDHLVFGAVIGEAVAGTDGRVALLGSRGMSHRFWPLRALFDHQGYDPTHIVTPEARAADHYVLECWARGDHAAVCDFWPEYHRHAPEGHFAHYLMLLGAIGGRSCTARGEPCSAYESSLGTGQVHVAFDLQAPLQTHRRLPDHDTEGWTLPQSPTGKSSLLPPPPWHYSGEIISADFTADPLRVAELLPPGMVPMGDGSGSFVFADWCSAADHDPRIRDDPAVGQYREAYCVLYGRFEERKVSRIPYIRVDSELSLVRGHVQGFPKKLGDIFMTRPVELGRGGVRKAVGSRFSGPPHRARPASGDLERDPGGDGRAVLSAVGGETAAAHPPVPLHRPRRAVGVRVSADEGDRFRDRHRLPRPRHPGARSVGVRRDRRPRSSPRPPRLRPLDGVHRRRGLGTADRGTDTMSVLDGPRREYRPILLDGRPQWCEPDGDMLVLPDGRRIPERDAVHLSPCEPSKILCVHLDFRSRAVEFGRSLEGEPPTYFQKPVSALNAHRGALVLPADCHWLDYEGEIAAVVGRAMRNVSPADVWDHLAGFASANEVGAHDFRDTDAGLMLRVKGMDGFCPIGPGIVRGSDVRESTLRTFLNREVVQEGPIAEMVWRIDYLLADLSRHITLLPGDVVLTGTPWHSRPMAPGDVVEVEIDGLGRLVNTVVVGPQGLLCSLDRIE